MVFQCHIFVIGSMLGRVQVLSSGQALGGGDGDETSDARPGLSEL